MRVHIHYLTNPGKKVVSEFFMGSACRQSDAVAGGAGVGVLVGGLLGLGIGALIKTDRWEEVPLDQFRVSLVPQWNGGRALGVAVSF